MAAHTARNIANGLSLLRLALTPVLLVLAWLQFRYTYFWTLLFAFATDAVDGSIARRFADEIFITFTLRWWQSDVATWRHARRRALVDM